MYSVMRSPFADRLQRIRKAADTLVQLGIGDCQIRVRLVAFPDDRGLVCLVGKVPVDTVVADIQFTILEPADVQVLLGVGNVLDLGKRLDPVDDGGLFGPEALVVLDGSLVHLEVLILIDQPVFLEIVVDRVRLAHRNLHSVSAHRRGRLPVLNIVNRTFRGAH
jgi:hypothetical protein